MLFKRVCCQYDSGIWSFQIKLINLFIFSTDISFFSLSCSMASHWVSFMSTSLIDDLTRRNQFQHCFSGQNDTKLFVEPSIQTTNQFSFVLVRKTVMQVILDLIDHWLVDVNVILFYHVQNCICKPLEGHSNQLLVTYTCFSRLRKTNLMYMMKCSNKQGKNLYWCQCHHLFSFHNHLCSSHHSVGQSGKSFSMSETESSGDFSIQSVLIITPKYHDYQRWLNNKRFIKVSSFLQNFLRIHTQFRWTTIVIYLKGLTTYTKRLSVNDLDFVIVVLCCQITFSSLTQTLLL